MLRMFSTKKKGKEKDPNNDVDDGAAAAARAPAEARAFPILDAEEDTQITHSDGGAALYRQLEQQAEADRQRAGSASATPHTPAAAIKTTKAGAQKIEAQSQRVLQKRLMKELRDLDKSPSVKEKVFTVSLVNDNLFEWDVRLYKFDPDSDLYSDLQLLQRAHGIDNIWLRVSFPSNFPFSPPFCRVLAPLVQGGYVLSGGAICMELLTPDGWSQAYRMESVIVQLMSTIIKGKARIVKAVRREFSEEQARRSYDYLVKTHAKYGWKTPPKGDG
eukprot:m.33175 g.33175  ORF g.33175 m.33175 type:complete len:274 (-) comp12203_c0_seq1:82-903(-)